MSVLWKVSYICRGKKYTCTISGDTIDDVKNLIEEVEKSLILIVKHE